MVDVVMAGSAPGTGRERRSPVDELGAALGPVRRALLAAAYADAAETQAVAADRAARILADARSQADRLRAEARERGVAEAAAALAAARARARRQARTAVLGARREAHDTLRTRGLAAMARLVEDPAYGPTRDRLVTAVRHTLGSDALTVDAEGGGVVGEAGGRRLDYSLSRFAEGAFDALAADLSEAIP